VGDSATRALTRGHVGQQAHADRRAGNGCGCQRGGYNWRLDMNADGVINEVDADVFVVDVFGTRYGDLDVDYDVDFADFVIFVFNYGIDGV
jgi:hypothetical protein